MKTRFNKFFILIIYLIGVWCSFAGHHPPPPSNNGKKPPPPPGLSIEGDIYLMLILVIIFGIYIIYYYETKTKTLV